MRLWLRWAGKDKLEALRKTEKVSGNEWWLLQDFWTGANGILDTYYVSKHPPSELVRTPSPSLLTDVQSCFEWQCCFSTRT